MQDKNDYSVPGSILLGAVIIAGAIIYVGGGAKPQSNLAAVSNPDIGKQEDQSVPIPVTERDHIRGNPQAKVTLVEFSDFQCPFCRAFHPKLQEVMQEFGQDIRWVYKHFPLTSIHPEALPAAMASECVWEQKGDDGFWKFADAMFLNQESLGKELYEDVAKDLGVNMQEFASCMEEGRYISKVQEDVELGVEVGVEGTPSTFMNGIPVQGGANAQLAPAIQGQLSK